MHEDRESARACVLPQISRNATDVSRGKSQAEGFPVDR